LSIINIASMLSIEEGMLMINILTGAVRRAALRVNGHGEQ